MPLSLLWISCKQSKMPVHSHWRTTEPRGYLHVSRPSARWPMVACPFCACRTSQTGIRPMNWWSAWSSWRVCGAGQSRKYLDLAWLWTIHLPIRPNSPSTWSPSPINRTRPTTLYWLSEVLHHGQTSSEIRASGKITTRSPSKWTWSGRGCHERGARMLSEAVPAAPL